MSRLHRPPRSTLGRALAARFAAAAAALAFATAASAEGSPMPIGRLNSAAEYVIGFVQYVRWPGETELKLWQVCVGASLADKAPAYEERTARGKAFSVRAVTAADSLADCTILDVTDTAPAHADALLQRARRLAILTVGEGERFCSAGGIACLRLHEQAGGFEINLSAALEARLMVNAQLLMLGRKRPSEGGNS